MSIQFITDRTEEDVFARTDKGRYTYVDLNRAGQDIYEIAAIMNAQGYSVSVNPKTDWTVSDTPTQTQMQTYLSDIKALADTLHITSVLPETMSSLDWETANEIERSLENTYKTITAIMSIYLRLGTFYLGDEI